MIVWHAVDASLPQKVFSSINRTIAKRSVAFNSISHSMLRYRTLVSRTSFTRASFQDVNRKSTVMSISPQSLASLAANYQLDGLTCARRITSFVRNARFGIDHVFDIAYARNYTLMEIKDEFLARFRNNRQHLPLLTSECPGWNMSKH